MTVRRRGPKDPATGKPKGPWMIDIDTRKMNVEPQHKPRVRRMSPVNTRRGAEQYERLVRQQLLDGTFEQQRKEVEVNDRMTVREFTKEFLSSYVEPNNKHSEIIGKRGMLRNHVLPAFGEMRLRDVGVRQIDRFKAAKLREGYKKKTVNNHLALLSKMLNVAVDWEYLERAPRVKLFKVPKTEIDFLDFGELERLERAADGRRDPMVRLFSRTGARLGEGRALHQDDVDLVAKRMLIRRSIVHGKIDTPKSGKGREIPLCDSLVDALKAHRHLRGRYLLCDDRGRMLSLKEMYGRLEFYCRKAGLRKIGFHTLRHTFASHLVMKGVPLKVVQELLGHSTIEMTMRYAHLSPGVKREYVNVLDSARHYSGTLAQDCT